MKKKKISIGLISIMVIMAIIILAIFSIFTMAAEKCGLGHDKCIYLFYSSNRTYEQIINKDFSTIYSDVKNAHGWTFWHQVSCAHPSASNMNNNENITLYMIIDINPNGDNPIGGTYTYTTGYGSSITKDLPDNSLNAGIAYIAYYAEQQGWDNAGSNDPNWLTTVNYPFNSYCDYYGYTSYINGLDFSGTDMLYSLPNANVGTDPLDWECAKNAKEYQDAIEDGTAEKTYQARLCIFANNNEFGFVGQDFIMMWGKELEIPKVDKSIAALKSDTEMKEESREDLKDEYKYENPVEIEAADPTSVEVTYKIKIKNPSSEDIKGEVLDFYNDILRIKSVSHDLPTYVEATNTVLPATQIIEYSNYTGGLPEDQTMYDTSASVNAIKLKNEITITKKSEITIYITASVLDVGTEITEEYLEVLEHSVLENRAFFRYKVKEQYKYIASSDFLKVNVKDVPEIIMNKYVVSATDATVSDRSKMTEGEKAGSPVDIGEEDKAKSITYKVDITYVKEEGKEYKETDVVTGEFWDESQTAGLVINSPNGKQTIKLKPGETKTVTVTASISAEDANPGVYTNRAYFEFESNGITQTLYSDDYVKIRPGTIIIKEGVIHKYIKSIEGPNGSLIYGDRSGLSGQQKLEAPAEVEQGYIVTYRVEVKAQVYYQNEDAWNGCHRCPSPCPAHYNEHLLVYLKCSDDIGPGLQFVECNLQAGSSVPDESYGGPDYYVGGGSHLEFTWKSVPCYATRSAEIKVRVTASNMQLASLRNTAYNARYHYRWYKKCTVIHAEWRMVVYQGHVYWVCLHNACAYTHPYKKIYGNLGGQDFDDVRLIDPIVQGTVWEDKTIDGLRKNGESIATLMRDDYKNIIVKLWKSDGTLIAKKTVDSSGRYSFGRVRKGDIKTGPDSSKDIWFEVPLVQKFNYNSASLVTYYITFEYNGEKYEATHPDVSITLKESAPNYTIDSNAKEQDRDAFNKSFETISYNRAYGNTNGSGGGKPLSYETSGSGLQVSTLTWNGNGIENNTSTDWASNYSSSAGPNRSATMIAKTDNFYFPDGDIKYLQYIDFGIYRRESSANMTATKDVVSAEVTINNHRTVYNYENFGQNPYVATKNNVLKEPYMLMIYREDYEFRTSYYINGSDKSVYDLVNENNQYKDMGRDNDLQIILTYKITVTNKSDKNSGLVAVVRELVDYYDKDEMELVSGMIRVNSENGEQISAYDSSQYSNVAHGSSVYTQKFLRGDALSNKKLNPGESIEVYMKYKVLKDADGNIVLDNVNDPTENSKMNIVEIGAYSFYKGNKPAGLVDTNSNPGNIEFRSDGIADDNKFEDDSFETGIVVVLREQTPDPNPGPNPDPDPDPNPDPGYSKKKYYYRNVSGVVFEELNPAINVDDQYVGNGVKRNSDLWVQNVLVKLYEVVQRKNSAGEVVEEYYVDTGLYTRTNSSGRYSFNTNIHAGLYTVRFIYGDKAEYLNTTDGNTVKYSGQDYQSVKYKDLLGSANSYIVQNSPADNESKVFSAAAFASVANNTTEFDTAGNPHYGTVPNIYSFAKDNEVRRLEVNEYSTTITYPMDTILKAKKKNSPEAQLLAAHTAMYADTRTFDMDIEYFDKYDDKIEKTIIAVKNGVIKTKTIKNFYYSVRDVDFGIIERPKTKLQMMKDITEIRAITSDGNTLIDIFFDINYSKNANGTIAHKTVVNKDKSIGYNEVQVLNRSGTNQGFRYANIDTDLLQGMTITVKFRIAVANISEVDHLASWFEEKMKASSVDLKVTYGSSGTSTSISGDHTTMTDIISSQTRTYNYSNSYIYKLLYSGDTSKGISPLTASHTGEYTYKSFTPEGPASVRTRYTYNNIKNKSHSDYKTGYYLGNIYYNSSSSGKEAKVETRVDQYIDYVDNDLIFKPEENLNSSGQVTHLTYTTKDIASKGLLKDVNNTTTRITDGQKDYYNANEPNTNNNLAFNIEDSGVNPNFYKYLEPIASRTNIDAYLYTIDIEASRTLTSELDAEGMIVDNIAEIVKVSNTVGRKVYVKLDENVTGYIGNTTIKPIESVNDLTLPPDQRESLVTISEKESDTDFTEYVTFSPPTGLTEVQSVVKTIVDKTGDILLIAIPVAIIIAGMTYVTIQMIRRKKFYK